MIDNHFTFFEKIQKFGMLFPFIKAIKYLKKSCSIV